jgi:hypothetical protein
MNLLVVCHDYKKHKLLTLVLGKNESDYIPLTPRNLPIISELTNGAVARVAFIDTDEMTRPDEFQYNSWDDVPNGFDYFFTVFCPGLLHLQLNEYKDKLTENGLIIDLKKYRVKPASTFEFSDFFPFVVEPINVEEEQFNGPFVYAATVVHVNSGQVERKLIQFDKSLIPTIDPYGRLITPRNLGRGIKRNRNRKRKQTKKTRRSYRRRRSSHTQRR